MMSYSRLYRYKTLIRMLFDQRERIVSNMGTSRKSLTTGNVKKVLGIETSCDDTGAAVVDSNGIILGDALNSQTSIQMELGGVMPSVAQTLHKRHTKPVVDEALDKAQLRLKDLDAIAVTTRPGLSLALGVGLDYAKKLVQDSGLPMIPIHHMEAHALTARMIERIDFPFLVFLLSGGHCLLAVARDVDDFLLIGKGMDDSPGDILDKTARELKLKNFPSLSGLSGGASIEMLAREGNPTAFDFPMVTQMQPSCNFSFSGLKACLTRVIQQEGERQGITGSDVLPNAADICASFQLCILRNLARKLQRAFMFCDVKKLLPEENRTLVMSGGVASNLFFRQGLHHVCKEYDCRLVCPPPKLCTDNGIMIAWNGMEKLLVGRGIADDPQKEEYVARSPLGEDLTEEVSQWKFKLPKLKLLTKELIPDTVKQTSLS